jgi:hypothetical protein
VTGSSVAQMILPAAEPLKQQFGAILAVTLGRMVQHSPVLQLVLPSWLGEPVETAMQRLCRGQLPLRESIALDLTRAAFGVVLTLHAAVVDPGAPSARGTLVSISSRVASETLLPAWSVPSVHAPDVNRFWGSHPASMRGSLGHYVLSARQRPRAHMLLHRTVQGDSGAATAGSSAREALPRIGRASWTALSEAGERQQRLGMCMSSRVTPHSQTEAGNLVPGVTAGAGDRQRRRRVRLPPEGAEVPMPALPRLRSADQARLDAAPAPADRRPRQPGH